MLAPIALLVFALLNAACTATDSPRATKPSALAAKPIDGVIAAHGKYTRAYLSDWASLPTADKIERRKPADEDYVKTTGEAARRVWENEDSVHLRDLNLRVSWEAEKANRSGTTLFRMINCKEIVIENLAIIQEDADFRGYHTILIEGADRVVVRNLYLAGTVHSYHVRFEGCGDVFVDNVEVAGIDYTGQGKTRVGGGIWINNGADKGGSHGTGLWMPPEHVRLPGWQIVQNSYFHGAVERDAADWRNQDAVLIHHPGDGLLFNCVVENWFHPNSDGGFDLSYRRQEPEYQDRFFRIERNIVRNVTLGVKTPGKTPGSNRLFFANNVFINAQLADYHNGASDEFSYVHNTYIFDEKLAPEPYRALSQRGASGYAVLWAYSAPTVLENSLIYKPEGRFVMLYGNNQSAEDKYLNFKSDHNVYALGNAETSWYRSAQKGQVFRTFDAWKTATSADTHSVLTKADAIAFTDYANGDFSLSAAPQIPADTLTTRYLTTEDRRMRVEKDFWGRPRTPATLTPGAFNAK